MENKDWAYQIIDNDAIKMNNGDNMVDVSTAYLAIDRARSDERHQGAYNEVSSDDRPC